MNRREFLQATSASIAALTLSAGSSSGAEVRPSVRYSLNTVGKDRGSFPYVQFVDMEGSPSFVVSEFSLITMAEPLQIEVSPLDSPTSMSPWLIMEDARSEIELGVPVYVEDIPLDGKMIISLPDGFSNEFHYHGGAVTEWDTRSGDAVTRMRMAI